MSRTFFATFAAAVLFGSAASAQELPTRAEMERYRQSIYPQFMACSDLAAIQILSAQQGSACSELLLRLKLSFLPGVTLERYHQMKPKTRAIANEKGYAAYRAWLFAKTSRLAQSDGN